MKHMIQVVMDGIRDTGMLADYAEEAREHGHDKHATWFAMRAKERLATLKRDWSEVDNELGLHKHNEELVKCMAHHIDHEIERVRARVDKM